MRKNPNSLRNGPNFLRIFPSIVSANYFTANEYLIIEAVINLEKPHGVPPGLSIPPKSSLDPFLGLVEYAHQIWCPYVQPFLRKFRTERYQVYAINIIDFMSYSANIC